MNKLTMSALAATALMTMPAFAQAPATNANGAAMTMQQSQISNLWRASKLDGVNIYNNANEKIGEIGDVLIDHTGKAMAVVVDVGGFLGMGEHRVALKFEDVKFSDMPMNSNTSAARSTNNNTMNTANTTATTTTTTTTAPAGAPPATVSTASNNGMNNKNMYPDHAVLNMTKDQLKALPQISYSK